VIRYRSFRNSDPPGLAAVWNESFTGRGTVRPVSPLLLETFVFAKPYFAHDGLIVALADEAVIGFALAGFGPGAGGKGVDPKGGILSFLAVLPTYRRQGVGTELLRRSETYLRDGGARTIYAGSLGWHSPFGFGLYGGAQPAGFLDSDALARPFLEKRSYNINRTQLVLQLPLRRPPQVADGRFPALRQRAIIQGGPWHGLTPWQEAVLGPLELTELRLEEKENGKVLARAVVWEMEETFSATWGEHAIGLVEVDVAPDLRRQGLAKFLLFHLLRHYQEQYFTLVEMSIGESHDLTLKLARSFGFQQVDTGRRFVKVG
jgi:ribosomal protein S18 acetylase RimI-like enzyme